jgi:hypothetical protein
MKLSDMKIMQKKPLIREKINRHDPGGHERCKDSITIKDVRVGGRLIDLGSCLIYFA